MISQTYTVHAWLLAMSIALLCCGGANAELVSFLDDFTGSDPAMGQNPRFDVPFVFSNGTLHGYDINGALNGNNVLVMTQLEGDVQDPSGNNGQQTSAGFTLSVLSNGENGFDQSMDGGPNGGTNVDVPNAEPAHPAIEAVNGTGNTRLQNGNVIRFSAWMRFDPNFPLNQTDPTRVPSVEPLIKLEVWKEALSIEQDDQNLQQFPVFGDKIFDPQLNGAFIPTPPYPVEDRNEWIDLGGDGEIGFDPMAAGDGRVNSLTADDWSLVEVTYEVNDFFYLGIDGGTGANAWTKNNVEAVEEIRATFFFGDFTGLLGSQSLILEGGNILIDNIQVELFLDRAAEAATPNTNPIPFDGLAGDFDGDGDVDGQDFLEWQRTDGTTGGLTDWQNNYGMPAPTAATTAVPEPSTSLLLLACVLVAATQQQRTFAEFCQT